MKAGGAAVIAEQSEILRTQNTGFGVVTQYPEPRTARRLQRPARNGGRFDTKH